MARKPAKRIAVEPVSSLHRRLLSHRRGFVEVVDFAFHGLGWSNPIQWDCEVYFDVPRERLGFSAEGRPGDVDMLLVPCIGRERRWREVVAVEVKAYRLARANRNKSPGDSGRAQVAGLAEMGFPYVGLLQVVPVEAGGEDEKAELPVWPTNTPMALNAPPKSWATVDLSGAAFYRRQSGRMSRLDLPECAGAKVLWLTLGSDGLIEGMSVGYERASSLNPIASADLIARLPSAMAGCDGLRCGYAPPRFRTRPV